MRSKERKSAAVLCGIYARQRGVTGDVFTDESCALGRGGAWCREWVPGLDREIEVAGVSFWGKHSFEIGPFLTEGENEIRLVVTGNAANIYGGGSIAFGLGVNE